MTTPEETHDVMPELQIQAGSPKYRGELALGFISAALGLVGLSVLLFAPLGSDDNSSASIGPPTDGPGVVVTHHWSLWSSGFVASAWPLFIPIVLAFVAIPVGTVMRSRGQLRAGSRLRWCGVAVTLAISIVGFLLYVHIGLFILPGAALGLATALRGRQLSQVTVRD